MLLSNFHAYSSSAFLTSENRLTRVGSARPFLPKDIRRQLSEPRGRRDHPQICGMNDSKRGGVEEFGSSDGRWQEQSNRANRWIVIVDDEQPIRTAVGQYLFDSGYQVTACADADTALKVCLSKAEDDGGGAGNSVPDAIVSDIRMPGMDGLEFLFVIRSDDRLMQVPVVLLTAKGMAQDRIAGYKAGADAYLPKVSQGLYDQAM